MATASPLSVAKVPGRLVLAPTSLSTAFPHGGTELGVTRDQELRVGAKFHQEMAEEWASPSRVLHCGGVAVFACVGRDFDSDRLALLPDATLGAVSQEYGLLDDVNLDAARAGQFRAGSVIMWSPVALEAAPTILLYNAVPIWDEAAKLQLSIKAEMSQALMFVCLPDASGRTYAARKIADLSL